MAKQIRGQMSLLDFIEKPQEIKQEDKTICTQANECEAFGFGCGGTINPCRFGGPYHFSKTECLHSGHSCNKEELWEVADSFDDISCSRTCCRKCNVRLCGARCNGSEEPDPIREWIGDDYLPYIMKALLNKHGALIGEIKNYSFEKPKDYIKPLADTVFKKHRQMCFWVDNNMYWLRWSNDGTDGSVLIIKKEDKTVANVLTREIIEAIQERYESKLDDPKAPIYHVSMTAVWNECPNCKNTEGIGNSVAGPSGTYYIDYNKRCPKCGQLFDWSDAAVEKATKYSKEYLEAQKKKV